MSPNSGPPEAVAALGRILEIAESLATRAESILYDIDRGEMSEALWTLGGLKELSRQLDAAIAETKPPIENEREAQDARFRLDIS